jgi:membrane protease YdiL (CAAX protease family)
MLETAETRVGSWHDTEGRRSAAEVLAALLAFTAWCALPALLARWLAPAEALLASCAAFAAALLATRARDGARAPEAGAARAVAAFAAAACAGALAQPAWLRGVAQAGRALALPPALPPLAAHALVDAPALWLAAGLVGPLAEELLFRERLPRALRRLGLVPALCLCSALFALPHREPWWMLGAFLLGLWLGVLARASRRVALCVGYHAGLNAACLIAGMPVRARASCVGSALAGSAALWAGLRAARVPRAGALAAGLGALLAAGSAAAAVYEWSGELRLEPLQPAIPPIVIHGAGVAELNGAGSGPALETLSLAGGISGAAVVPVTDPVVSNAGLAAVRWSARLGTGSLRPFQPPATFFTPQLSRGELPVFGDVRLCFFVDCSTAMKLPLAGQTVNGSVGLGVGGLLAVSPSAPVRHSVIGAPWTPRTALLSVPTPAGGTATAFASGFAHGPFSFTGSTAAAGGVLQLVTPLRVESLASLAVPSGFARLTLHFVPEPRALLVLAPSIALLAAGARRRRRRGGG